MNNTCETKNIQENQYSFPYHYLPQWDGRNYSQHIILSWGYEYLSYNLFISEKLAELNFDSLLDVGCGDGRFLHEMYKRMPSKHLAGIDYYEPAIKYANIMTPNVKFVCGDIRESVIFDEKFDVITLIDVLEHIPLNETESFIMGIYSQINENGKLLITVPSDNTSVQKKHFQHFNLESLKNIVSNYFEVEDVNYLNRRLSKFHNIIRRFLFNRIYQINSEKLLGSLFRSYMQRYLMADPTSCRRIFVKCAKK